MSKMIFTQIENLTNVDMNNFKQVTKKEHWESICVCNIDVNYSIKNNFFPYWGVLKTKTGIVMSIMVDGTNYKKGILNNNKDLYFIKKV